MHILQEDMRDTQTERLQIGICLNMKSNLPMIENKKAVGTHQAYKATDGMQRQLLKIRITQNQILIMRISSCLH
jgi:hypothetical protein